MLYYKPHQEMVRQIKTSELMKLHKIYFEDYIIIAKFIFEINPEIVVLVSQVENVRGSVLSCWLDSGVTAAPLAKVSCSPGHVLIHLLVRQTRKSGISFHTRKTTMSRLPAKSRESRWTATLV